VVFQTALTVMCQRSGFAQHDLAPVRVRFRDLADARSRPTCAPSSLRLRRQRQERGPGHRLAGGDRQRRSDRAGGLPLIRTCRMLRAAGLRVF
jgi:septum formation protein